MEIVITQECEMKFGPVDSEMKFGPVSKLDRRNKKKSNNFNDEVMSEKCDVIIIFPIYGQFEAIR